MEKLPFSEANFRMLLALVKSQSEEIAHLKGRIKELEGRLNQNSSNSSRPPSSDGFKKRIANLRKRSGKKPGGQPGHQGDTLQMISDPDEVILHLPNRKNCCSCGCEAWEKLAFEVAQVVDIPVIKAKITEHRKVRYKCRNCGEILSGTFPEGIVANRAQYGEGIQSLAVYFNEYHFIPYHRLKELFSDCFSLTLSVGSLVNFIKKAGERLATFEDHLRDALLSSSLLHGDETGMRCESKTQWIHSLSNDQLTYYQLDAHRGTEGQEQIGLLPAYKGHLVHDRYASYFQYEQMDHSLCNAHLLRELKYLYEQEGCCWAEQIKNLLLKAKEHKEKCSSVSQHYKTRLGNEFKKIVLHHLKKEDRKMAGSPRLKRRGKPKRSKAHNLLRALCKYQKAVLAFIMEPNVPFDNNQAERDLRMVKTKQKISGCFRSTDGGQAFCRIRSYLSTLKKNNENILQGIKNALKGNSYFPDLNSG